jgi:uncharacterized protein (DUF1778 family)
MTAKKAFTRGKPMNLYVREDDKAKMRELIAYAATNGHSTSNSLIVRAALRVAGPNRGFLCALKDTEAGDLRFKRE